MVEENSYRYRQLLSCKCLRIRQASRVITQFYDKKLKSTGIKITQLSILSALASGKTTNISLPTRRHKLSNTSSSFCWVLAWSCDLLFTILTCIYHIEN